MNESHSDAFTARILKYADEEWKRERWRKAAEGCANVDARYVALEVGSACIWSFRLARRYLRSTFGFDPLTRKWRPHAARPKTTRDWVHLWRAYREFEDASC